MLKQTTKRFYFIRHAQSQFNIAQKNLIQKLGNQYDQSTDFLNILFDLALEDIGITKQGYNQSAECAKIMKDKKIDFVIVSPLRRALITCYQIFKDHPLKPPIQVNPNFRQLLEGVSEIGSLLRQSKAKYPDFDYSLIDDIDAWYVHTLEHDYYRKKILDQLQGIQQPHQRNKKAKQATLQVLKQVYPERCKGNTELKKKMLPSTIKQKKILLDLMKKYNQIAVVTHSQNLKQFIGYKIKNCQVYEISLQQFQKMDFQNDSQPWRGLKIEQDAI